MLQILKSKYLEYQGGNPDWSTLAKKEDAHEVLSTLRQARFLVAELDNLEKKAESAFKKQSNSQVKIRFEDLLFDEEKAESTRKNWKKSALQNSDKTDAANNPLFLKEKLMLCKERIKEKEKEIESLDKEVKQLDSQKKDLEYLYGDQYLEEVFDESEIKNLRKGNKELETRIKHLEEGLKDFGGSQETFDLDDLDLAIAPEESKGTSPDLIDFSDEPSVSEEISQLEQQIASEREKQSKLNKTLTLSVETYKQLQTLLKMKDKNDELLDILLNNV